MSGSVCIHVQICACVRVSPYILMSIFYLSSCLHTSACLYVCMSVYQYYINMSACLDVWISFVIPVNNRFVSLKGSRKLKCSLFMAGCSALLKHSLSKLAVSQPPESFAEGR